MHYNIRIRNKKSRSTVLRSFVPDKLYVLSSYLKFNVGYT